MAALALVFAHRVPAAVGRLPAKLVWVELIAKASRFRRLKDLLREFGDAKVLVFVLFKREAKSLAKMLQNEGIQSWPLEGNMSQASRSFAMQAFREAKTSAAAQSPSRRCGSLSMEDETDGWGDFEEIDFAEADDPPSELKDETPEAEDVTKPKDAEKSATSKPSGWGSLMNFGQALLAEASHALTTDCTTRNEPEPDSPDDKLQTDLAALLQHYHHVLEDIYRQHNPERVNKRYGRYREQAEKVEDFGAFKAHCEEKLESFHQAVCKKYDEPIRAASAPPIRAAIVAIYETHNPAKLSHVDELLQKFKGKESTLYKSICEKYGVEPDPAWLEDEPKAEPTTSLGGLFGGAFNAARSLGGATALQSLQTAAEGLHTLREKVERSFDEALADRGDALAEPGEASGGTKDGEEEAGPPDTEATVQEKKDSSGEDPHLDQILSKYREQILSRPQDANNPQVLERYRERLESLYKAISARYVDEGKEMHP
eukprot:g15908.t1